MFQVKITIQCLDNGQINREIVECNTVWSFKSEHYALNSSSVMNGYGCVSFYLSEALILCDSTAFDTNFMPEIYNKTQ